jgi:2-dehydropantoate 2-reductase
VPHSPDHWHILGAGSIGCLFTAHLARAGLPHTLLLRDQPTADALHRRGGITLEQNGHCETIAVAAESVSAASPISRLLLCTKAQQSAIAFAAIAHRLAADATVLLLQNGMGVYEALQPERPRLTWLQGLSTEGAWQRQRFHVVHAGRGETVIGAFDSSHQAQAWRIVQHWRSTGLAMNAVADIRRRQWLKLAVNSVINPLTALHRCRNGELLTLANIGEQVQTLCAELAAVAATDGQSFSAAELAASVFEVMHSTAANRSSMLQDIEAGRETEIDFINGYVVQKGDASGIDCPAHRALWERVRFRP